MRLHVPRAYVPVAEGGFPTPSGKCELYGARLAALGLAPLPTFDGASAVIGSWVVGGQAAGIGIRESDGPITGNTSRFVPHRIG